MKWGSERPETDTEHTGCPRIRPCEPGFQRDSIWFKLIYAGGSGATLPRAQPTGGPFRDRTVVRALGCGNPAHLAGHLTSGIPATPLSSKSLPYEELNHEHYRG